MSRKENERLLQRYYQEMWNPWNFGLAGELLAEDIRFRGSLGREVQGIAEFQAYMRYVQSAFPDFSNTVEERVSERNRIFARLTCQGTHRGEVFGIPPTGRRISYSGAALFRISRGKIAEGWVLGDTTELIRQLDAPPATAAPASDGPSLNIVAADYVQREWAAALMASSEPWITLGRGLEACRRACLRPHSLLFVALSRGAPCGFIILQRRGLADSPYIKSVAVAETHRGQGVGTRLIHFAEEFFRGQSRHLFLCVSSFNTRARALYERLGFTCVAPLENYVISGAAEILMHKPLDA